MTFPNADKPKIDITIKHIDGTTIEIGDVESSMTELMARFHNAMTDKTMVRFSMRGKDTYVNPWNIIYIKER